LSEGKLPPGQRWIGKTIEYAELGIPKTEQTKWRLRVRGLVKNALEFTVGELEGMMTEEMVDDLHCVEGWSVKGARWQGVPLQKILNMAHPRPSATHVFFRCADGYSTVVSIEDVQTHLFLLAMRMNGYRLTVETGFPVRLVTPGLYAWKYAKWITEIELMDHYEPGYWESRGYHRRGDVWREERRAEH